MAIDSYSKQLKGDKIMDKIEREIYSAESHLKKFIKGKIAFNCRSEESAKKLLESLDILGVVWVDGRALKLGLQYDSYKEETCYDYENGKLTFADVEYYENEGYKVVIFE